MSNTRLIHRAFFSIIIMANGCSSKPIDTDDLILCTSPRPEICTMEYAPVCGYTDSGQKTYASGCTACSDKTINTYTQGECETDKRS